MSFQCCTVCVCVSRSSSEGSCARLARELWSGGLSAVVWSAAAADAHHTTRAGLVLEHDAGHVLASCWEGSRVRVYKQSTTDIIEFVKQKLHLDTIRSSDYNRTISWTESDKTNTPSIFVTFINYKGERISKNMKRQHEVQINNQITSILTNLGLSPILSRVRVCVIAFACNGRCVRQLSAMFSLPLETRDVKRAITEISDLFPKYQNILDEALCELTSIVKQNNQSRCPEETAIRAVFNI